MIRLIGNTLLRHQGGSKSPFVYLNQLAIAARPVLDQQLRFAAFSSNYKLALQHLYIYMYKTAYIYI
jgi:hypothetical protein